METTKKRQQISAEPCSSLDSISTAYFDCNESQQADNLGRWRQQRPLTCSYMIVGHTGLAPGKISYLDTSDLLICGRHKAELNHSLTILIRPERPDQWPFMVHATVMRDAGMTPCGHYAYNCLINTVTNLNVY